MTPSEVLDTVISPTLDWMGDKYASHEAEVILLAIQQQEDKECRRFQIGGPACGLWQFEPVGVRGVLSHPVSGYEAAKFAARLGFWRPNQRLTERAKGLAAAIFHDDRLACVFARLLLWTDPHPLPVVGDGDGAWWLYLRTWNPGRPRPEHWRDNYLAALDALAGRETA